MNERLNVCCLQHNIRKVNFLSKDSILKIHFHEFFTQNFLGNFLVKSNLSTAKNSKTITISRVFHPKKINYILGISKLHFWTNKNEDYEQCVKVAFFFPEHFEGTIRLGHGTTETDIISCSKGLKGEVPKKANAKRKKSHSIWKRKCNFFSLFISGRSKVKKNPNLDDSYDVVIESVTYV